MSERDGSVHPDPGSARPRGCAALATAADRIGAEHDDPRAFVVALGAAAAGIRPGIRGYVDLLRGGRDRLPGRGFRADLDDDTDGQARHFAGIAAAAVRVGPRLALLLSRTIGGDSARSADGRLSDAAVEFTALLRSGELAPRDAGSWVRAHVCGR